VGVARDNDGNTRGYVLEDGSLRGTPKEWASRAVALYHKYDADRIVAEKNQGGEMVEAVLKTEDRNIPVTLVHATRGKYIRAEPVSALYEQGKVHHIGRFDKLEDQMCLFTWDADRSSGNSPDRVDALVWALTAVFDKIVRSRKGKDSTSVNDKNSIPRPASSQGSTSRPDTMWMAG
jgi:phage terminase large subunit-like protein